MISAGVPSTFRGGRQDHDVPSFGLLLYHTLFSKGLSASRTKISATEVLRPFASAVAT